MAIMHQKKKKSKPQGAPCSLPTSAMKARRRNIELAKISVGFSITFHLEEVCDQFNSIPEDSFCQFPTILALISDFQPPGLWWLICIVGKQDRLRHRATSPPFYQLQSPCIKLEASLTLSFWPSDSLLVQPQKMLGILGAGLFSSSSACHRDVQ